MIVAGTGLVLQCFQSAPSLKWLLLIELHLRMLCRITNCMLYLQAKELSWRKSTLQQLRDAPSNIAPIRHCYLENSQFRLWTFL